MSMEPYYSDDAVVIYHGDCREIAGAVDYGAVVSDPPYGMGWNTDSTRFTGGERSNIKRGDGRDDWGPVGGDHEPFDPAPWIVSPWCVLFGFHHFAQRLPVGSVLVWIKRHDELFGSFLSDCELAWKKGGHGVYAYRKPFPPPSRMAETGTSSCVHPTQKPTGLMEWAIMRSGAPDDATVLDPFMGSGTTLVAAKNLGRKAIGIEIEEKYCEIAAERCRQEVLAL